jgi:hypothetical protein
MANEHTRDRGNLFENAQKKKPSQPDYQGDCTIDGTAYEIRGWRREDQLTVNFAPPRGDQNTYPPDVFRGAFEAVPARAGRRGAKDAEPTPVWMGDIVSDDAAYTVRAFEKQGKSGMYLTLSFERIEKPTHVAPPFEPDSLDIED